MVTILMNDYPKFKVSEFQFWIPMLNFSQWVCKITWMVLALHPQKVQEVLGNNTFCKQGGLEKSNWV